MKVAPFLSHCVVLLPMQSFLLELSRTSLKWVEHGKDANIYMITCMGLCYVKLWHLFYWEALPCRLWRSKLPCCEPPMGNATGKEIEVACQVTECHQQPYAQGIKSFSRWAFRDHNTSRHSDYSLWNPEAEDSTKWWFLIYSVRE